MHTGANLIFEGHIVPFSFQSKWFCMLKKFTNNLYTSCRMRFLSKKAEAKNRSNYHFPGMAFRSGHKSVFPWGKIKSKSNHGRT